jgi:hypothetical protein
MAHELIDASTMKVYNPSTPDINETKTLSSPVSDRDVYERSEQLQEADNKTSILSDYNLKFNQLRLAKA